MAHTREAKRAVTFVLGLDDIIDRNQINAVTAPIPPIDYDKLHYTVGELLAVPENAFIVHFYRCLLKRDPDTEGTAVYSARWLSGDFIADIIHDISRSPEALGKGVRVSGLLKAVLRRWLSGVPLAGRLFAIAAHLAHLPELARQSRALQRRPLPEKARLEKSVQSLRAEVSALAAQGQTKEFPSTCLTGPRAAAIWALL